MGQLSNPYMMTESVNPLEQKFYELLSRDTAMQRFLNHEAFAGIWVWDLNHRQNIWLSKSLEKLLGFEEDHHLKIPLSWNELLPLNDIDKICNSFDVYLANDTVTQFEMDIPFLKKDSRSHYLKCRAIAVDNQSYLLGLVQTLNKIEDTRANQISEFPFLKKEAHLVSRMPTINLDVALFEDQKFASKYESLINAGDLGGWEYCVETENVWCSKEYFELLGYETSSIKSWEMYETQKVWADLIHPEDLENARVYFAEYLTHLNGVYRQNFRMRHASGNWIWILSKGKAMIEVIDGVKTSMVIGTHTDVSDNIRLEQELLKSNELTLKDNALFKSIINSPDNIFIVSIDTAYRYTSFSENYKKFTKEKFGKDISIGYNLLDLFSESQLTIFKPALDAALQGEHVEIKVAIPLSNGQFTYVDNKYNPILNENGKITGATVFIHDISKERKAEIENEINELRYTSLFAGACDAIFIADAKTGFLVDANSKAIDLIGYTKSEILAMHQTQLHPPELLEEISISFKEFATTNAYNSVDTFVLNKMGKRIPVQITGGSPFQIGDNVYVAAYFRDITNKVQITNELKKQNQQLKDIAWAQSHKVRAPLTRIMGLVNALDKGIIPEIKRPVFFKYVTDSANELDAVIKEITAKTISL